MTTQRKTAPTRLIGAAAKPQRRNVTPRKSYIAEMVARAIDDEEKAGTAKEDLRLLPPLERNRRLRAHLKRRRLSDISDREFRKVFNGR
jgi:hypothetical protein